MNGTMRTWLGSGATGRYVSDKLVLMDMVFCGLALRENVHSIPHSRRTVDKRRRGNAFKRMSNTGKVSCRKMQFKRNELGRKFRSYL